MTSTISTSTTPTPASTRPRRLGELLIEQGAVTPGQLEAALEHQSGQSPSMRLGEILVALGFVTEQQVVKALAAHLGLPFLDVEPEMIDAAALKSLPQAFVERHNLLPLSLAEGWLTVALEQFNDPFLIAEIARISGLRVQPVAAAAAAIRSARHAASAVSTTAQREDASPNLTLETVLDQTEVDDLHVIEDDQEDTSNLEVRAGDSPIVRLVNFVIKRALDLGASDIHIEPDEGEFQVRYRVDGELCTGERLARRLLPAVVSRIKILGGMDISERRVPQDGSLTVSLQRHSVDLRVSTMTTRQGEKVVMRVLDRSAGVRPLEELGLGGDTLSRLRGIIREPHGLTLVTGPTGSGKSTTLYSMLTEITSEVSNTSSIEDPVERRLRGVNQFQVHEESGFTFARALRAMLRQDPDVLMVGEIRDSETARLATEAALTGHLVLSTLHTNDAESAVPRLVSMGAERFLVAATLRGVLAQRLVRRLCESCRRVVEPSDIQRSVLATLCGPEYVLRRAYVGSGCPRCKGRGSIGRIGVFDLLRLSEELIAVALAQGEAMRADMLRRSNSGVGLLSDGLAKVSQGIIGLDSLLELTCHAAPREAAKGASATESVRMEGR